MQTFVRSLLVLTTLLAAATAQSNCKSVLLGVSTQDPIDFEPVIYKYNGAQLNMENACQLQQGRMLAGELVTACNADPYGTPPDIREEYPPRYARVDVTCPGGCPNGGVAKVVQYCY